MPTPNDYTCSILQPVYKESQADWASGSPVISYGSITRRPDAFSADYLTAFTYGPDATGSVVNGLTTHVWKAVADSSSVTLYRANDANTDYNVTLPLFSYTGSAISEIDIAFDTAGNPVVSAERPTGVSGSAQVWFYYFDSVLLAYTFANMTNGRTPRTLLDNPIGLNNADLLLTYTSGSNNKIFYRQQRDRYQTEYSVPVPVPQAVSGTFFGYAENAEVVGSATGSVSGTILSQWTGSSFIGTINGSLYGSSTGTLFEGTSLQATGSFEGTLTGSLSGTFNGFLSNIRYFGSINTSSMFFGQGTGSFSGSISAYVNRPRSGLVTGSFGGFVSGSASGSLSGITSPDSLESSIIIGNISGSATGSITGNLIGSVSGSPINIYTIYIEDAAKMSDSRVAVLYTRRNSLSYTYAAGAFETVLYTYPFSEPMSASLSLTTSSLVQAVISTKNYYPESFASMSLIFMTSSLLNLTISAKSYYPESFTSMSLTFVTASLPTVIISAKGYYPESFASMSLSFVTGSLRAIVVSATSYHPESFTSMSLTFVTASLS